MLNIIILIRIDTKLEPENRSKINNNLQGYSVGSILNHDQNH